MFNGARLLGGRHRPRRYTRAGLGTDSVSANQRPAQLTAGTVTLDLDASLGFRPGAYEHARAVSRAADVGRVQERCVRSGGDL